MIIRISAVVQEMMRETEVIAKVNSLGLVPTGTSPDELRRLQAAHRALWTPAIKASGFRPTD